MRAAVGLQGKKVWVMEGFCGVLGGSCLHFRGGQVSDSRAVSGEFDLRALGVYERGSRLKAGRSNSRRQCWCSGQ